MSDFILDYDILETIAKNSNTISKKANEYADSLTSKVANAINVVSPSSGYLSDASYYVNAKVDQLQQKAREFSEFANKINNLAEMAKRVDEEVAELLAQSKERFLNYHESLRIDDWKASILEWLVDIKNSLPILELIGNVLSSIETILESLTDNIKHWYQCEGGKYIFGYIASVALAVVAIALFIGTLPASGFFAICGAIGAGIAALDAVTNIATSWRAVNAAQNGDPAWANIYGKQDKLSDVLRQTNFNNGLLNNLSYFGANTLDTAETFCDIVGFAEIGAGIAGWAGKNKGNIKNTLIDLKDSVKKSFSDFKVGGKDNVFGIVDDVDGNVVDNLDIGINKDVPVIGGVDVPNNLSGISNSIDNANVKVGDRTLLSGDDWNTYFAEQYGADNVEWTSKKTISYADKKRIEKWDYPPKDDLYIKYKSVYQNELYFDQYSGKTLYPADNGFFNGNYDISTIKSNSVIDRIGSNGTGQFFSPVGTDYSSRALPPFMSEQPYTKYYVLKEFEVKSGKIAPWFDEIGGGIQYFTDVEILDKNGNFIKATVESLIENGYLIPIK